ncbi:MAG: OsmC family protein [Kiloniellales bacterium]|nr:OsmC family protein [Kiloniellales bacterium]
MTRPADKSAVRLHDYATSIVWTGNLGDGTSSYEAYGRQHEISCVGKPPIQGSSDPAFKGDPSRYNPEDLLVASLSACHMLWYLHLCAKAGVTVVDYRDEAQGQMAEERTGGGRFTNVVLRPVVTITAESDRQKAHELHHPAHANCFIASSVNFPVRCEPKIVALD